MKKKIVRIVILSLMLCCVNYSNNYAGWLAPDNYEDCILEGMKGVTSDVAARAIANACRKKFPIEQQKQKPQQKEIRQLTYEELTRVSVSGSFDRQTNSKFYCELYNGNANIVITEITIEVREKAYNYIFSQNYPNNNLSPRSKRNINIDIAAGSYGTASTMSIIEARGYDQ